MRAYKIWRMKWTMGKKMKIPKVAFVLNKRDSKNCFFDQSPAAVGLALGCVKVGSPGLESI